MAPSESKIRSKIRDWVHWVTSESSDLNILISGKNGTGKSSLINTLLCRNLTAEKDSKSELEESHTATGKDIEQHMAINGVNVVVTVQDVPKVSDSEGKTHREIQAKAPSRCDLLVYCIQMTQTRSGQDEYDSIIHITKNLGVDVWKNAVFALTFDNEVRPPPNCEESREVFYKGRLFHWEKVIRDALEMAGVQDTVVKSVPIVPTSYHEQPILDNKWFVEFWSACLQRIKFKAIPNIVTVTFERSQKDKLISAASAQVIVRRIGDVDPDEKNKVDTAYLSNVPAADLYRIFLEEVHRQINSSPSPKFALVHMLVNELSHGCVVLQRCLLCRPRYE